MKFSTLSKAGFAASLCAALAGWSTGAQAGTLQDTIFAKVEPSVRDRMFFRLSYINVNIKTTSKDAYDVTGPVLAQGDVTALGDNGITFFTAGGSDMSWALAAPLIDGSAGALINDAQVTSCAQLAGGLGTPCGIKAKSASRVATPALSVGAYIDDARSWSVEAFLLALPISADVYGDGENGLNGKKIIQTKLLPPLVVLGHHFGRRDSAFKPFLGLGASYAIFYGTKATESLNAYQGGAGAGDTTVSIKNAFAVGPFAGFKYEPKDGPWSFGLNIGKIRFKTTATLVTQNTVITGGTGVLKDYGPFFDYAVIQGAIPYENQGGITVTDGSGLVGFEAGDRVDISTALMCDLAKFKYGRNDCNHGTFVRKAKTTLDNTMFVFSVGRSF
jgi:outer membrane protein